MNTESGVSIMRWVVILGLLCTAAGSAWGDGMYFSPVADPPSIPTQRAIVIWRDGVETLVVESTVKTESPDLGWVLPLPAEPKSLDVMDAGTLTCMAACQRPVLLSGRPRFMPGPLWTAAGLVALVVVLHLVLVRKWNGWRYVQMLLCCFLVGMAYCLNGFGHWAGEGDWAELSAKGHAGGEGIEVSDETRIGNYTATVLRAKSSAALDDWLGEQHLLTLDAAGRKIVDEYIAAKWCFVVARLRKDVPRATPQPIVARFATAGPVYPMKLTALNGATTHVDLYVLADRQAQAAGFECIAADAYEPTNERSYYMGYSNHDRWGTHYRAKTLDLKVGNPDVGELMWDGCVLTALAADVPPENMTSDTAISLVPLQPARATRCTEEYREDCDLRNGFFGGLGLVVFAGYMFWGRRNPGLAGWLVTVGVFAAAVVVTSVCHNSLPQAIPTHPDRNYMGYDAEYEVRNFLALKAKEDKFKLPLGEKDLEALVQEAIKDNRLPLGLKKERSPGNWSVRTVDGQTFICFYDQDGIELRELPEPESNPYNR